MNTVQYVSAKIEEGYDTGNKLYIQKICKKNPKIFKSISLKFSLFVQLHVYYLPPSYRTILVILWLIITCSINCCSWEKGRVTIDLLEWRQPPSLRVRIIDNLRFLTASAEEAARPVIVIREAVALFVRIIHASFLARFEGAGLEFWNPSLAIGRVAFQLVYWWSFDILRNNASSKLRVPAHSLPQAAPPVGVVWDALAIFVILTQLDAILVSFGIGLPQPDLGIGFVAYRVDSSANSCGHVRWAWG